MKSLKFPELKYLLIFGGVVFASHEKFGVIFIGIVVHPFTEMIAKLKTSKIEEHSQNMGIIWQV